MKKRCGFNFENIIVQKDYFVSQVRNAAEIGWHLTGRHSCVMNILPAMKGDSYALTISWNGPLSGRLPVA